MPRSCRHAGPERRGAGSMPAARRISQPLDGATVTPSFVSPPWIRRYPRSGFSFASRTARRAMLRTVGGRPGLRRLLVSYVRGQLPVPGQQRRGRHRDDFGPAPAGYEPRQRGEPRPVSRLVPYPAGRCSGCEQGGELLGVGLGIVAVAVVEQDVGDLGVAGEGADLGCPCVQLVFGVAVAEPLVDVFAGPFLRVAVQADYGQAGGGGGQHRGDGAGVALRHVDAHIRQLMGGQELQGLFLVAWCHPGPVAEFHAYPPWRGPPGAGQDVVLARAGDGEPVGFQKSATCLDLGFYAARSYSLMRLPRTGRRLIRSRERSVTG